MLNAYYSQLQKLYDLLSSGQIKDPAVYFETIKLTALIILQSLGGLIGCMVVIGIPVVVYRKGYKKITAAINMDTNKQEMEKTLKQLNRFRICFVALLLVAYVPFMIPTVLFLM